MTWEREQIGACTLYRGDAREVLPTLGPVDAVVTDPPYGVHLSGKATQLRWKGPHGRREARYAQGEDTPAYVTEVVLPVLAQCRILAPAVVIMPGIRNLSLYPPFDDLGCFYAPGGTGVGRWGFTGMHPILYYGKDPYLTHRLGSRINSCGNIMPGGANDYGHPCAKPLAMMVWLVKRASLETMSVCDPFMGSGTTGVACVQLGRSFIGIEIEEKYFSIACQRIEDATRQGDLFVSPVPHRVVQEVLL